MINVEICAASLQSAEAAKLGGAHRIELCRDLSCGGLTPSMDNVACCVGRLGLRTHVLVRPRAGNFYYNADEVAEIISTIEACRRLGAAAVVVGFLTYEGLIDTRLTRLAVEAANGMEVTFHRAFDEAHQPPLDALHAIADCGCTRLLTSGQKPTALEGAEVIAGLVGATHVEVMAGGGVTPANVRQLMQLTGVREVHGSCKTTMPDGTVQTDPATVNELIKLTQQ
ncbi:MAG: copper homeostasis protein CutC [Bacteroidales bacterium]|nr:copper homeostasis protein CutC [Bacteroidales bacterium]